MSGRRIDFSSAPLEVEAPGIAGRHADVDGTRWAIVTYEPGTLREEFCDEPHSGYVIGGSITYEFEDGGEPLALGITDAFTLSPGHPRHRGRAGEAGVTLFLIDAEVGHGR